MMEFSRINLNLNYAKYSFIKISLGTKLYLNKVKLKIHKLSSSLNKDFVYYF